MRGALSVTAADADIILFVQDPTAKEKMFRQHMQEVLQSRW